MVFGLSPAAGRRRPCRIPDGVATHTKRGWTSRCQWRAGVVFRDRPEPAIVSGAGRSEPRIIGGFSFAQALRDKLRRSMSGRCCGFRLCPHPAGHDREDRQVNAGGRRRAPSGIQGQCLARVAVSAALAKFHPSAGQPPPIAAEPPPLPHHSQAEAEQAELFGDAPVHRHRWLAVPRGRSPARSPRNPIMVSVPGAAGSRGSGCPASDGTNVVTSSSATADSGSTTGAANVSMPSHSAIASAASFASIAISRPPPRMPIQPRPCRSERAPAAAIDPASHQPGQQ